MITNMSLKFLIVVSVLSLASLASSEHLFNKESDTRILQNEIDDPIDNRGLYILFNRAFIDKPNSGFEIGAYFRYFLLGLGWSFEYTKDVPDYIDDYIPHGDFTRLGEFDSYNGQEFYFVCGVRIYNNFKLVGSLGTFEQEKIGLVMSNVTFWNWKEYVRSEKVSTSSIGLNYRYNWFMAEITEHSRRGLLVSVGLSTYFVKEK